MIYLAVLCGLELVGTLVLAKVLLDSRDRAEEAWSRERAAHARQIADLCQRLQAPEHAVTQHYNEAVESKSLPAVMPDDDEDFWEAKDALAERLAAEEVNRG